MAMSKKDRVAFDNAIRQARVAGALRWTSPVRPDVPVPTYAQGLTIGWLFNTHSARVVPACSSSVHHSFGRTDRTDTQGSRALYSTELLALQALRHELEQSFARQLAEVDERIEAAKGAGHDAAR